MSMKGVKLETLLTEAVSAARAGNVKDNPYAIISRSYLLEIVRRFRLLAKARKG